MKLKKIFCISLLFVTIFSYAELPQMIDPFIFCVPHGVEYGYTKPFGKIYGFPILRVFGWSKNGHIAYSLQRNIEGRGGVIISYIIQDLITDSIAWKFDDDSFKWDTEVDNVNSIVNISFSNNSKLLSSYFNKYQIIQGNSTFFNVTDNNNNEIKFVYTINDNGKDLSGFRNINYEIIAQRKDNKTKIITSRSNITADNIYICGFVKSPFENRIALIVAEEKYVFEGNELFYSIFGCYTDAGFK